MYIWNNHVTEVIFNLGGSLYDFMNVSIAKNHKTKPKSLLSALFLSASAH